MAQRSSVIPVRTQKGTGEVHTWPSAEPEGIPQEQARDSARGIYETSRVAFKRALRNAQRQLGRASSLLITRVRNFATERPLHFVAMVAGASFLAGVALRVWRSNRHA